MAGPLRPRFVLFGSSIVQYSFGDQGWGSILADVYARKADVILRGYGGWTSRNALQVLDQIFPKDASSQPSLVVVYFGGNDAMKFDPSGYIPYVPLPEFIDNMKKIVLHLKSLSDKTRIILLTPPPLDVESLHQRFGDVASEANEERKLYSEAILKVCVEMGVHGVDIWSAIQRHPDWPSSCLKADAVHLSKEGSKVVVKEILKVIREADWNPCLHWKSLPCDFLGITPTDCENFEQSFSRKLQWE